MRRTSGVRKSPPAATVDVKDVKLRAVVGDAEDVTRETKNSDADRMR